MWCNEVREALPLLDPDDPDAREVLAHVAECPGCAEQLQAYRADEQALSSLRGSRGAAPLAGFADAVMARLSEAGPAAPLPLPALAEEPVRAMASPAGEPRGEVIRLGASFPTLVALAAALLLAVGLLLSSPRESLPGAEPGGVADAPIPLAPTPGAPVVPELASDPAPERPAFPAGGQLASGDPLPAPVRTADPAPMPLRRSSRGMDVVPVDRGGRRGQAGLPGFNPGELPPELQLWLNRALPGLERLLPPAPRPADRPDEVRF